MKIGLLAPPWLPVPPLSYGGTEAVVDRLARGFVEAGHEVLLYAPDDSTCPVPRVPGVPASDAVEMGQAAHELRHALCGHLALAECDIVHDHTLAGALVAPDAPGAPPVVTTFHGPFTPDLVDVYAAASRRAYGVAISHRQAADAARVGVRVDAVVHHGIDPGEVTAGDGSGGYLVFLGRMTPDKGADVAVRVARASGLPLRIAAKMREPAEVAWFKQCVEPLLGGDVEYVGEVDHAGRQQLLAEATALVNPIRWSEPFGLVMVESLAAGTPVLTFPNGAAPEIVQDGVTGFVCRDEAEMVDRAGRLGDLDRPACRQVVDGYFSTGRMVEEHLDLYTTILRRVTRLRRSASGASAPAPHLLTAR